MELSAARTSLLFLWWVGESAASKVCFLLPMMHVHAARTLCDTAALC
jgi:hypothetical protein